MLSTGSSPEAGEPERAASPAERKRDPREFEGRGSLRGQILMADGLDFPTAWAVHVGPSRSLRGRERAVSKRIELTGDSHEFIVEGLPLGGYDVWIEAEGLRSRRRAVLLTRGSSSPYVNLQVTRMGFIDGFVFRESGAAAENVLVALEPILGQVRREVRTRPDGSYRFERVEDGEYRLHFGPAETPLLPARELYFRAPSLRFPQVVLPPTVDLLIYTQDVKGQLMPSVRVSGFGSKGGLIDVETDATGRAWARNLVPGLYRINASTDGDKLRARKNLEVTLAPDQECWLVLR